MLAAARASTTGSTHFEGGSAASPPARHGGDFGNVTCNESMDKEILAATATAASLTAEAFNGVPAESIDFAPNDPESEEFAAAVASAQAAINALDADDHGNRHALLRWLNGLADLVVPRAVRPERICVA